MKDGIFVAFVLSILAVVLVCEVGMKIYRYNDCRRVGHTQLYCVTQ